MLLSQDLLMSYIKSQASHVLPMALMLWWDCFWHANDAGCAGPCGACKIGLPSQRLSERPSSTTACLPAFMLQRALPAVGGEEGLQHRTSSGVDAQPWELSFDELQIGEPIGEGSFGRVSCCRSWPAGWFSHKCSELLHQAPSALSVRNFPEQVHCCAT